MTPADVSDPGRPVAAERRPMGRLLAISGLGATLLITGVLGAVFAATAIGLSVLLGSFPAGDTLAVAASTLLVVALFGPLRRRAQSALDRRFDRPHYDASRTMESLTAGLSDDIDLERVEADVLGFVDRRFNRTRYDAERTVAAFSARLRDEVDIATVTSDLHATVQGVVKPVSLGLWIRATRP